MKDWKALKKEPEPCAAPAVHDFTDVEQEVADCGRCNRMAEGEYCPRHAFLLAQGIVSRKTLKEPHRRVTQERRRA